MINMDATLSYCGLICLSCPIYLVAREPDNSKKEQMVSNIIRICKEEYNINYTPADITDCDGCMSQSGIIFSSCKNCKIKKCAVEKGLANCAYCEDYACDDLAELFKSDPTAKARLDEIRSTI